MDNLIRLLATLGICLTVLIISTTTMAETVYRVGIVPQHDTRTTHTNWRPILNSLETRTGLRFTIQGSPTIPAFEQELLTGQFDFAYMNPYQLLIANNQQGYIPLVRDTGNSLYGIVVVRKDSTINSIRQLQGRTVAFPAPNALGATLLVRAELERQHNIQVKPRYVKTHDSVYLNVILGETVAGGGVKKTLLKQPETIRHALRVLYTTNATAPHPIAAHPRVPEQVRNKVKKILIELGQSQAGARLLSAIPIKSMGSATLADYQALKKLALDTFYKKTP